MLAFASIAALRRGLFRRESGRPAVSGFFRSGVPKCAKESGDSECDLVGVFRAHRDHRGGRLFWGCHMAFALARFLRSDVRTGLRPRRRRHHENLFRVGPPAGAGPCSAGARGADRNPRPGPCAPSTGPTAARAGAFRRCGPVFRGRRRGRAGSRGRGPRRLSLGPSPCPSAQAWDPRG